MRLALTILLLVLPVSPLLACEGFEHDMNALEHSVGAKPGAPQTASFGKEFESLDELKRWTENSTFGGGRVERGEFAGHDLAFAYRSYTSGVKSSDAAVYVRDGSTWKLVKAHPIVMNDWIVAEQSGETIVFHSENAENSLMVLTSKDLENL